MMRRWGNGRSSRKCCSRTPSWQAGRRLARHPACWRLHSHRLREVDEQVDGVKGGAGGGGVVRLEGAGGERRLGNGCATGRTHRCGAVGAEREQAVGVGVAVVGGDGDDGGGEAAARLGQQAGGGRHHHRVAAHARALRAAAQRGRAGEEQEAEQRRRGGRPPAPGHRLRQAPRREKDSERRRCLFDLAVSWIRAR